MKNIYLLPTQNNKSKLAIYHYEGSKNIKVGEIGLQVNNNIGWTHCWSERELYITSDEKIKQGDWYIYDNRIWKMRYPKWRKEGQLEAKKIVLTTDPDLIKDAIQAIDNEFLEWFVQNLSCEKVEIKHIIKEYVDDQDAYGYDASYYTIIIPKKEPIHTSYTGKVWEPSKQETVEEAAEKYWSRQPYNEDPFVEGVKWQKTRSYTYEEMKESFSKGHDSARLKGSYKSNDSFEEDWEIWSNQFKKK